MGFCRFSCGACYGMVRLPTRSSKEISTKHYEHEMSDFSSLCVAGIPDSFVIRTGQRQANSRSRLQWRPRLIHHHL